MSRRLFLTLSLLICLTMVSAGLLAHPAANAPIVLVADVVATGIPGAGAITQVATFHKGGPIHDNATFAASTLPGRVLEGRRLLVASTSNFGAPLARADEAPGSILSLDVSSAPVAVPADFAAAGGQATAADGAVILYTAQSPAFVNGVNNPAARTRELPAVSLPLGISINNGFGRPWFANGPAGYGTITVIDPSGVPLAGAPSTIAGGVFANNLTNRGDAPSGGLASPALATTLLTKAPDGTGRAVFLAALADGSVAQVHVQKGVDLLVPPGSFAPLTNINTATAESADRRVVTRVGMVFNWVPTRIVFVTDPLRNRILALDLSDDGTLFQAASRYLSSPELDIPVDVAAAVPETAARNFASGTTLGGGSDLYVLNRGNNTIARMTQSGRVTAVAQITAPIGEFRVNGIAVSEDARTIWVTATLPGSDGVVLRVPAFGSGAVTNSLFAHATAAGANGAIAQGADIFSNPLTPVEQVGPLFNHVSCVGCHSAPVAGGMGTTADTFVTRVAHVMNGAFDPMTSHGGPIARARSISEFGLPCGLPTGVPPQMNATSRRSAMTLRGTALIDNIQLSEILKAQAAQPATVRGRLNVLADGRIGRFGWKAQTATLVEFMAEALRDEMGVTNPLAANDFVSGCGGAIERPEADGVALTGLVAFLNTLDPPAPAPAVLTSAGAALFASTGCASCHTPSMAAPGGVARLYSDLLLHDMGALADGFEQGSATGSEFRTAPLWRLADRQHFLHDGRASSIADAIDAHSGQGAAAREGFRALSSTDRQLMLDFLNGI